jgi:hypothetical protein
LLGSQLGFRTTHRAIAWILATWSLVIVALAAARGYGLEHGITEALIPLGFAITSLWSWPDRWQQIGLATAGLCAAQAITIHLVEGHWAAHLLFFLLAALLHSYRAPVTNLFLAIYLVFLHAGLGTFDRHSVYGHGWPPWELATLISLQVLWLLALAAFGESRRRSAAVGSGDGP